MDVKVNVKANPPRLPNHGKKRYQTVLLVCLGITWTALVVIATSIFWYASNGRQEIAKEQLRSESTALGKVPSKKQPIKTPSPRKSPVNVPINETQDTGQNESPTRPFEGTLPEAETEKERPVQNGKASDDGTRVPERNRSDSVANESPLEFGEDDVIALSGLMKSVCGEDATIEEIHWQLGLPNPLNYRIQTENAYLIVRISGEDRLYKSASRDVNWQEYIRELDKTGMSYQEKLILMSSQFRRNWTTSAQVYSGPDENNWSDYISRCQLVYREADGVLQVEKRALPTGLEADLESVRQTNESAFDFVTGRSMPNGFGKNANRVPKNEPADKSKEFEIDSPLGKMKGVGDSPPADQLETIINSDGSFTQRLKRKR